MRSLPCARRSWIAFASSRGGRTLLPGPQAITSMVSSSLTARVVGCCGSKAGAFLTKHQHHFFAARARAAARASRARARASALASASAARVAAWVRSSESCVRTLRSSRNACASCTSSSRILSSSDVHRQHRASTRSKLPKSSAAQQSAAVRPIGSLRRASQVPSCHDLGSFWRVASVHSLSVSVGRRGGVSHSGRSGGWTCGSWKREAAWHE
eukprot:scaffold312370_cov28-Tisochrysis_lutea.AAC.3